MLGRALLLLPAGSLPSAGLLPGPISRTAMLRPAPSDRAGLPPDRRCSASSGGQGDGVTAGRTANPNGGSPVTTSLPSPLAILSDTAADHGGALTVGGLIAALVAVDDHGAVPEFTFDGEQFFRVHGVIRQADLNVELVCEPVV